MVSRGRPVTLIELGTSAGWLLHLDRHHYPEEVLSNNPPDGRPSPTCSIETEVVGDVPALPGAPVIDRRIGIDLHPIDILDPVEVRWLAACTWPEHVERAERLRAAVEVARHHGDVEVVGGDLIEKLPKLLRTVPGDTVPCVFHSATLAYLDADERAAVGHRPPPRSQRTIR